MTNVLMALLATTTMAVAAPPPGGILGMEAAAPIKAWANKLAGVKVVSISIQPTTVVIQADGGCELRLHHPAQTPCQDGSSVGDASVCWNPGCPETAVRNKALRAAGSLSLPWRTPGGAPPAARGSLRAGLIEARKAAHEALERNDLRAARKALKPYLKRDDIRPVEYLSLLPIAQRTGLGAEAWKVVDRGSLKGLGPALDSVLRVTLLMGPSMGVALADQLMTAETACTLASLGSACLTVRAYDAAMELGRSIRTRDPACFEAYGLEVEAATMLRDLRRQAEVAQLAMARFAGDARLTTIEEPYLEDHGQGAVVLARLEARLASGERNPGLLKDLLGYYIEVEGRTDRQARFMARADGDPDDHVAAFFAGVILHYEKDFASSSAYLNRVTGVFPKEPRLFIYLAMNAYNLGDRKKAERFIDKAAKLDLRDPDVPYCVAEIYRDTKRKKAFKALKSYWHQTAFTSDPRSVKQRRVKAMMDALDHCITHKTPAPCPGPWEHTFNSANLKKKAVEDDARVKRLEDEGMIGGGTTGPPAGMKPPPGWDPSQGMPPGMKPPPGWDPSQGLPPGMTPPPGWDPKSMPPGMTPPGTK